MVEGDLKVLGIRFKLLGEVWIYRPFHTPGPLLQNTQLNRSRRVRGESLALKSKVEREMPFLAVSVLRQPTPNNTTTHDNGVVRGGTVLQGQTSSWTLRLSNLGYAPASNITLKTNSPWLNILDSSGAGEEWEEGHYHRNEYASTSYCIGPSGTLMGVPFKSKHFGNDDDDDANKLDQPCVLQPGETIDVPVTVRTSGGGRQAFYMLFRYELWDGVGGVSGYGGPSPRHRWARKLLSVPVYPSITMSASIMPSYSNKGEHVLSIELMNYRSDRETKLDIYLDKISIASRYYEVRQLGGQMDSNALRTHAGSGSVSSSLCLGWQERVTIHYLVVPLESQNPAFTLSTLSFSGSSQKFSGGHGGSLTDFMCRERAHEMFILAQKTHKLDMERMAAEQEKDGQPRHVSQIRRAKGDGEFTDVDLLDAETSHAPPKAHPTSISSLCPVSGSSNINIICCWAAIVEVGGGDEIIRGQHHLRNLLVRPQNKSKGCPLALTVKHKAHLVHDFSYGPLTVDLEITIRNRLVESPVDFEFALENQNGFDFVGCTCFKWNLSGGSEITVPLKALFFKSGVYNLQSVRLTVLKTDVPVPYLFPLQWTVTIDDE